MNIMVVLAYDGSAFHGFQRQKEIPSVQETVEKSLCALLKKNKIVVTGAGRTDAGVHALYQVINFRVKGISIPPEKIAQALNHYLPETIRAQHSCKVRGAFNARYYAQYKTYQYFFYQSPGPLPFLHKRACWVTNLSYEEEMRKATGIMKGRHDFSSFANKGSSQKSGICHVKECSLHTFSLGQARFYAFTVTADRFLFNMVRNMVGKLWEIGRGESSAEEISEWLSQPLLGRKKYTAPPDGLYLTYVHYEKDQIKPGFTKAKPREK